MEGTVTAGNRYGVKNKTKQQNQTQNSVLLAKNKMLALASQEWVEQIQGGKPVQTKMNKGDRQVPHVMVGT